MSYGEHVKPQQNIFFFWRGRGYLLLLNVTFCVIFGLSLSSVSYKRFKIHFKYRNLTKKCEALLISFIPGWFFTYCLNDSFISQCSTSLFSPWFNSSVYWTYFEKERAASVPSAVRLQCAFFTPLKPQFLKVEHRRVSGTKAWNSLWLHQTTLTHPLSQLTQHVLRCASLLLANLKKQHKN